MIGINAMNVLVTGGAGFIGSNLIHFLLEQHPEWQITVLDSLTYAGNLENLAGPLQESKIGFVKGDIADGELVRELFDRQRFQVVFHLAAESHVDRSIYSANEFVRTNVQGTQTLLNAAMTVKRLRFVHVSTDEVYGSLGPQGSFLESSPLNPTSPYAASKAASDLMVLACYKTHGLDAVITRCTNNYGPYQFPEKFIPLFVTNALEGKKLPLYGDGLNVRSWIFVRDHCEALMLAAKKGAAGQIYNIGGGTDGEIPNIQVAKTILAILNKPESLIEKVADRPAHDRRYAVNSDKARAELGWRPRTCFEEGLQQTVKWYVERQSWWQRVKSGEYQRFYQINYVQRDKAAH